MNTTIRQLRWNLLQLLANADATTLDSLYRAARVDDPALTKAEVILQLDILIPRGLVRVIPATTTAPKCYAITPSGREEVEIGN
jgi:hypothetical protein